MTDSQPEQETEKKSFQIKNSAALGLLVDVDATLQSVSFRKNTLSATETQWRQSMAANVVALDQLVAEGQLLEAADTAVLLGCCLVKTYEALIMRLKAAAERAEEGEDKPKSNLILPN